MENALSTRIADQLRQYPPFDQFEVEQLAVIAEGVKVRHCEKGEVIFAQEAPAGDAFFVVWQGAVALHDGPDEEAPLVDLADAGDLFGLRPLLAADQYRLTAVASEESLLFVIPNAVFRPIVERDSRVAWVLATAMAADGLTAGRVNKSRLYGEGPGRQRDQHRLTEVQIFDRVRKPVLCQPETAIKDAALQMRAAGVGSIIVTHPNGHPQGILTDTDLRNKVATGEVLPEAPVADVMSAPVVTIPPGQSVALLQMTMIRHRVHHLVVTLDGTPDSPMQAVVSEHDLLVIQGNSPAILVREIRRCSDESVLRQIRDRAEWLLDDYLEQEVAIAFIADVMSGINDALIARCVELSVEALKAEGRKMPPDCDYCWMALGSEGREEQLLRTDQDSALIFADVAPSRREAIREWLLALAALVTSKLNALGYEYCPADMMASNPSWCLSQTEWRERFAGWIHEPGEDEVMHSNIFFDFRPVAGNHALSAALAQDIFNLLEGNDIFLTYQARNALRNPPPLGFFRNLMLERNGAHRNEFDIKARAMMPLVDAARVLILQHRMANINNTFRRFEKLAELEPTNRDLFEQAADAYELFMRLRTIQGLRHRTSGRYFSPDDLNKVERLLLRNAFKPINDLQKLLSVRFRLNLLG